MNLCALNQPEMATVSSARGPLSGEARSLRQRLDEIRALIAGTPSLSNSRLLEAMHHVGILVNHIAAHGHAEERIVYPYIRGCDVELAALRADHVRLDTLSCAIIESTPAQNRAALHSLLEEFLEVSEAHFLVEGEACMPIVHARVSAGTEQLLFEAVEIETFDHVLADARGSVEP